MKDDLLRTYLNDPLAGAVAGVAMARRQRAGSRKREDDPFFERLVQEIEEDQAVLRDLRARLGSGENPAKQAAAWLFHQLSLAKLNHLFGRSAELDRFEELEGLMLGVRGKLALWTAPEVVCRSDPRFQDVDLRPPQAARAAANRRATRLRRIAPGRVPSTPPDGAPDVHEIR